MWCTIQICSICALTRNLCEVNWRVCVCLKSQCQNPTCKHIYIVWEKVATRQKGSSSYSASSPALGIISISYFRHSHKHVAKSHHGFKLRFPDGRWWWTSHVLICHLCIFDEVSVQIFCSLFMFVFFLFFLPFLNFLKFFLCSFLNWVVFLLLSLESLCITDTICCQLCALQYFLLCACLFIHCFIIE